MRVLIAEDDPDTRPLLQALLTKWGYEVVATADGTAALAELEGDDAPQLAILDVMMPGLDGIEVCRRVRQRPNPVPTYVMLLTAKTGKDTVVEGLQAGADDYITKPFDTNELRARVQVGTRILKLQQELARRINELEDALAKVKHLQGLLPMCSYCKKIRDDQNYWQQVESYITQHTEAQFSHSICPDCYASVVRPEIEKLRRQKEQEQRGEDGSPLKEW